VALPVPQPISRRRSPGERAADPAAQAQNRTSVPLRGHINCDRTLANRISGPVGLC